MKYILFIFLSINFSFSQQKLKDSLLAELKISKEDTTKIQLLVDTGDYYYYKNIDTAYAYYQKAYQLSKQLKSEKFEALSLLSIGYYFDVKERYSESLDYFSQAIELYKAVNDESGVAMCYKYIGYSFAYVNSLENSMKYYFKALKIYKKLNDSIGVSDIYEGLGGVHYEQENYENAYDYYLKSYKINEALGDKSRINASMINIGNAIADQGRIDEGLVYYFNSIKLSKELNDREAIAINYVNIGDCYIEKENHKLASYYLNKSLILSKELGYKSLYPFIYSCLAQNYLKQKKYDEVVINANKSLEYSKKVEWVDLSGIYNHEYLSLAYEKLGDYKKAYENHKLFKTYNDSIFNVKKVEKIAKLDALYNLEANEEKIVELLENDEIRELKLKNRTTSIYGLIIAMLLLIIIIYFLNKHRKEIKKAHNLLSIEKEKAEESDRLKSSFLANMSHEIRTPMNAIMGFSSFLKNPDLELEKRNRFVDIINNSGERLMTIINDIVDISKIESNQLKVEFKEVYVQEALKEVVEIQKKSNSYLLDKGLNLKLILLPEDIYVKTDINRFVQVLNNLINNALKFTESGDVEVGFYFKKYSKKTFLEFYVKDSGCGIPTSKYEIIFDRFSQVGENDFKEGNGLGLSICKGIISLLGGEIWVKSAEGAGSTFYFTIPY